MIAQVIDVLQLAPLRPEAEKELEARYRLHSKAHFDKVAGIVRVRGGPDALNAVRVMADQRG